MVTETSNNPSNEYELTEAEKDEVIRKALSEAERKKRAAFNEREYLKKISAPKVYQNYTAEKLKEIILKQAKSTNPDFTLDSQNVGVFDMFCLYFSSDPDFERCGENYSLKKSLMLAGPVGCGKTTIMKLFQNNFSNNYALRDVREVSDSYMAKDGGGELTIKHYSNNLNVYPEQHNGQTSIGFCFDDLGTEGIKKYFGSEVNVMHEVILNRYRNGFIKSTHFTTNLNGPLIEESYGIRVRSRLREMCNVIAFDSDVLDRRL